jgi:AGCS family alanine or glycine:cation symporter
LTWIVCLASWSMAIAGQAVLGQDDPVAGATGRSSATSARDGEPSVESASPVGAAVEPSTGPIAAVQQRINRAAEYVVQRWLQPVLFFQIPMGVEELERFEGRNRPQSLEAKSVPLVLAILVLGGLYFTVRFGFVNLRLFRHSVAVIRGRYDDPDDEGEVSHFQALTSALSATVGLGNIAGVAVAMSLGGPGALFWMWVVAFFGMSAKFSSCTLAQLYRHVKPDGSVLGGPMIYLQEGIAERFPRLAPIGKGLAVLYAILTIGATFGGGNMFQGNQTFSIFRQQFSGIQTQHAWLVGLVMGTLVGLVIIGGIRRIGSVTSRLVPVMCLFYCAVCLAIIGMNFGMVPGLLLSVFTEALAPHAYYGGLIGVLVVGSRRAAFSNEAGIGSAAIAHAAARTDEPVREGVVAMIGPFIDTILVCTMTGMAILVTGAHLDPASQQPMTELAAETKGVEVTAAAFASLGSAMPYFLCIAVFVFAYSTMISWSYYGERAVEYLFGMRGVVPYRYVYVLFVILGPILSLQAVLDFSDMMLLSMAFPNIIGMALLSGLVASRLRDYATRLSSGAMEPGGG